MATTRAMTAEDLLALPDDGRFVELARGEPREVNAAGFDASAVAMIIGVKLGAYVFDRRLGLVTGADGGYVFERGPDTVYVPDVACIRRGRLPAGPPDLAVEVVSPNDRPREVAEKAAAYLALGVRLVWVVDPPTRTATVYRPGADPVPLAPDGVLDGVLDGAEVVPGFRLPLPDLFATLDGTD